MTNNSILFIKLNKCALKKIFPEIFKCLNIKEKFPLLENKTLGR